jgi:hypothetical protein
VTDGAKASDAAIAAAAKAEQDRVAAQALMKQLRAQ